MGVRPLIFFLGAAFLFGCSGSSKQSKDLPILGRKEVVNQDTLYHTIPDFRFIDQDSSWVTPATFKDRIYVTDFFFTTCPTICPKMKRQLYRVYKKYKGNDHVAILSHTIDPKHDSVPVLKEYADKLGVRSSSWHFVTGQQDTIYAMAEEYLVSADEDSTAPGGYVHSGAFILVDDQRRIRGYYDGTSKKDVNNLIRDIKVLLDERFPTVSK